MQQDCPCGSSQTYAVCCAPYITGNSTPDTPEKLMRSRYTAYTQADTNYIANTMKSPAADNFDPKMAHDWAKQVEWLKLEVLNINDENDDKGFVEFTAHFAMNGKRQMLHERSEFHRIDGRWFYINGVGPAPKPNLPIKVSRVGRNEPCICGSGNKYKKCCGKSAI